MTGWVAVCRYDALVPERGVAALLGDAPVAVFRTHDGALYALSNVDPFSGASVLARGIVGDREDTRTVASPIHKQVFDLTTGQCLDDPAVSVTTFDARIRDTLVEVRARPEKQPTPATPLRVAGHDLLFCDDHGVLLDGQPRPVPPAPMAVLHALAAQPGHVVPRERLLSALPSTGTDAHAIETAVARLRAALGAPGLVNTVVKRGYRLALDP